MKDSASSFPPEFTSYKVLPSLLTALEYGGATAASILPLVLQFGQGISLDEYSKLILSPIIKLYASPDRGTRVVLLEHLPEYVEKLDKKAVSEKIFPHLVSVTYRSVLLAFKKNISNSVSQTLSPLLEKLRSNLSYFWLQRFDIGINSYMNLSSPVLVHRKNP